MFQTGYSGVTNLAKKLPLQGGICLWYFIPLEQITAWPAIDPTTQYYTTEPTLTGGAAWLGPVPVPEINLGYTETFALGKGGLSYKLSVDGVYPGDNILNRVNIENLPYYRYAVVAKLRAGGAYILIGDKETGLDFNNNFTTGHGGNKNPALSNFGFIGESMNKAAVLPVFMGVNVLPT